ncbi:hypothetical protein [Achromobacter phage SE2]|nr:hypothetical protein [Achromobacter phage SE2]
MIGHGNWPSMVDPSRRSANVRDQHVTKCDGYKSLQLHLVTSYTQLQRRNWV